MVDLYVQDEVLRAMQVSKEIKKVLVVGFLPDQIVYQKPSSSLVVSVRDCSDEGFKRIRKKTSKVF